MAITLRNLAATLSAQGQYRDALVKLDEAVKLAKTIVPADAELEFRILDTRGTTYFRQDKFDKAQQCFLQAVAIANRAGRNEQLSRSDLGQVLNNLGTVYLHKKKYPAAEETFGGSVRALESQYGQLHPYVAVPLNNLGLTLLSQSRYSETITVYRRSIEIAEHDVHDDRRLEIWRLLLHLSGSRRSGAHVARRLVRTDMVMRDGRVRDSVLYSIVNYEWPGVKQSLLRKLSRDD